LFYIEGKRSQQQRHPYLQLQLMESSAFRAAHSSFTQRRTRGAQHKDL